MSGPKHFFSEITSKSFAPECFCFDEEDTSGDVGVETFANGISASTPSGDFSVALTSRSDRGVDFWDYSGVVMGVSRSGSGSGSGSGRVIGRGNNI